MAGSVFLKMQQTQDKLELLTFVNEMEQLTQGSSELGSWMDEEETRHEPDEVGG